METHHFGSYLKDRRQARGLTLADVSRATKIKEESLELLEAARVDALPAQVFVAGFITAYARVVGADEGEAQARYKRYLASRSANHEPFPELPAGAAEASRTADGRRRAGVALVVLLLLIVATLTLSLLLRHGSPLGGMS